MKIDGNLAWNIDFEITKFHVHEKTRRKTSILKLQSVKIGGSLARNACFEAPTCLVSILWFFSAKLVAICCNVVLRGRRGTSWHSHVSASMSELVLVWQPHNTFALRALHSTPYTPHFTLYTLQFTLYNFHSTLYTLHSRLYTLHSTLHTPHCRACHGICTLSQLHAAVTMRFAKTPNTTRLKCCVRHAKWRWRSPKCCACHKKCNASSENVTKVLRLPHKTTFDTLRNTSECHEVPRPKRGYAAFESSKSDHFYRTHHRHGHMALSRSPPNGCGRLRNVWRTQPQPPDPQSEKGTLATRSGNAWKSWKKHCSHGSEASESAARRSSACSCRASILRSSVKIPSFRICSVQFLRV